MTLILPLGVAPSPVPLLTAATVARPDRGTRRAELVRVMRGVYAPAQAWRELAPWERYVARVHAASIVHPDAVFILESAAALLGLPIFGEPQHVHVLLPEPASSRAFSGVQIHTRERMPALELRDGLRVATACETVVEMARLRHPAVALALAGMALRADPALAHADLRRTSAAIPTSRGAKRAKWVFDRASGVPESTLEHVSLAAIEWLGFDAPTLQHWVRGAGAGDDDRLDFCWEYERIGGEADGDVKYSGDYGDAREALAARNARDARLLRRGVTAMAHWGWRDVRAPQQLRALLTAAGLRPVRPEEPGHLHTLAAALTSSRLPRLR